MIQDRHPSGTVMSAQEQRVLNKLMKDFDVDENDFPNAAEETTQDGGVSVLASRIENVYSEPRSQQAFVQQLAAYTYAHSELQLDDLRAYCTSDAHKEAQERVFIELDLGVVQILRLGPLPSLLRKAREGQDSELAKALSGGVDDWFDSNVIAVLGKRVELVSAAMTNLRGKVKEPWFQSAVVSGEAIVDAFLTADAHALGADEGPLDWEAIGQVDAVLGGGRFSQRHPAYSERPVITQDERDMLHEEMRAYLRDLILRLDEWKPLSLTQLRKTIDKIFIGHGWANPLVPNAKAFRQSLYAVAEGLMDLARLPKTKLREECQALANRAQRYTGLDVFMAESSDGFLRCNWETDYPSVLGHDVIGRNESTIDTPLGQIVLGIDEEYAETIRSQRADATLRDESGQWLAYCNFHIVSGTFRGRDANADFVLAMDELDDTAAAIAHALSQTYGADKIFKHGDLAILSHVEVREDHRGKGLGVRFLTETLAALLGRHPEIRSLATSIVPAQYEVLDNKELPKALITNKTKDEQRLEQYFNANRESLVNTSGRDTPLELYVYEEILPPDFADFIETVGAAAFQKITNSPGF